MSQENVEIVKTAHPPSGTELTALFADDSGASDRLVATGPLFHPSFEFEAHGAVANTLRGRGLPELVDAWREWMEAFDVYWTEVEDFLDAGEDQVLVILRDHGRLKGSDAEIKQVGASLWTIRDRKVARIDFYPSREQGLAAAGLRE
ncbi:MAG TPA: nuclear transport factor 2 family protein [Actinomycetota bacterium]|jgi:ketosteroid isomerase-like protein|nr:nuclear transport factor 2 family protein [Actinomycetota bacterium]